MNYVTLYSEKASEDVWYKIYPHGNRANIHHLWTRQSHFK